MQITFYQKAALQAALRVDQELSVDGEATLTCRSSRSPSGSRPTSRRRTPNGQRSGIAVRGAEPRPAPRSGQQNQPWRPAGRVRRFFQAAAIHAAQADHATPTHLSRLRSVSGAEVWATVSAPERTGRPELPATENPDPAEGWFCSPDGGKTVRYMLRFLSTRGEAGRWSETANAMMRTCPGLFVARMTKSRRGA